MLIYINQFVLCILCVCYVKYILNVFEMDKLFYSQIQRLFCLGQSYFVFLKLVSFDRSSHDQFFATELVY